MPTIDVLIDEQGNVSIDAIGFSGQSCEKMTAALEHALGKLKSRTKKREYHNVGKQTNKPGIQVKL